MAPRSLLGADCHSERESRIAPRPSVYSSLVTLSGPITRDDIEVLIFATRDDFTNWQSGNEARVIYKTGRKTVGDIDVPLKNPGTYDLVFSNKHAVLLLRNIEATVKLEYDSRER